MASKKYQPYHVAVGSQEGTPTYEKLEKAWVPDPNTGEKVILDEVTLTDKELSELNSLTINNGLRYYPVIIPTT